jgi:hypothetical protein
MRKKLRNNESISAKKTFHLHFFLKSEKFLNSSRVQCYKTLFVRNLLVFVLS